MFAHQPLDCLADTLLYKDQVSYRDLMMGIDVARKRSQASVRHADRYGRHVFERIGHGEQEYVQCANP